MAKPQALDATFAALRAVLEAHATQMLVLSDKPGDYQLAERDRKDRAGQPLFAAAVRVCKNYVSFHLMPVYGCPKLLEGISPELRKRMQGKACFNFTSVDPVLMRELAALTSTGLKAFRNVKLPWD
jgi:hypothetical protein